MHALQNHYFDFFIVFSKKMCNFARWNKTQFIKHIKITSIKYEFY